MAQGKYAKYVVEAKDTGIRTPERDGKIFHDVVVGEETFPEAPNWIYTALISAAGTGWGHGDTMYEILPNGEKESWQTTPHVHEVPESFVLMGTDPSRLRDLRAEVEFWIGEGKDAEKFTITKSTYIYIPANLVHAPVWVKKVDRPFIFIAVLNDPVPSRELGDFPYPPDFSTDL
jgi:hypothetical protein